MKNDGVSVIITAYHTADYIEECLDSISNQTWFKTHDEWEILVGIDHCEETLKKVKSIMHKYTHLRVFYMDENVGTYITSNTLIEKSKYSRFLRFDSDDIMKEEMVEKMVETMNTVERCKIVQCYFEMFPKKEGKRGVNVAHGVFLCKKTVFKKCGGFMPWKCAADTEFLTRTNKEYTRPVTYPLVLFYYRMHDESLTKKKDTSMQSELRAQYRAYIEKESASHPVIKTVTAPATEIFPETEVKEEPLIQIKSETHEPVVTIQKSEDLIPVIFEPGKKHYVKKVTNAVKRRVSTGIYNGI